MKKSDKIKANKITKILIEARQQSLLFGEGFIRVSSDGNMKLVTLDYIVDRLTKLIRDGRAEIK